MSHSYVQEMKNFSISQKMLSLGLSGLIILVAASTYFWTNRLDTLLDKSFEEKISLTETFIGPPLTEALWDFNEGLVQSSLAGLENFDAFIFAQVFSDNEEFARFSPRTEWQESWDAIAQTFREDPELQRIDLEDKVYMRTLLSRDGQEMGELYWSFSRAHIIAAHQAATYTAFLIGAFFFVVFAFLLYLISRSVAAPIQSVVAKIDRLQSGEKDFEIPEALRKDEVGQLGKTLESFRESLNESEQLAEEQKALEAERLEQERQHALSEREQELAMQREKEERLEEEKQRAEAEKAAENQRQKERAKQLKAQEMVVATLGNALTKLSDGNLDCAITTQFSDGYEKLRADFNAATERLAGVIGASLSKSEVILSDTKSISEAAKGLAHRSERQASTLGETALALGDLTKAVQSSASVANEARVLVQNASDRGIEGESVVAKTISAMSEIEQSSTEIARITSVIEQIAFQTNLLALNAGVEAARAGDAGHGFAVVAAEVRALAGRSQEAVGEINSIISTSSATVERGAELVRESGNSLGEILTSITDISSKVEKIAGKSQELSGGITEINGAVTNLDQTTQENVTMFEETTAAISSLTNEAGQLQTEMSQFSISADSDHKVALAG